MVLKVIIVVLLILLIACILFAVFLGRYVEYTDDGVKINLPWSQEEPDGPETTEPVVIITQTPSQQPSQAAEEPAWETIGAVEVSVQQLTDGTAAQSVTAAGGNALVVEMKNAYGRLSWDSNVEQAVSLGVAAGDSSVRQAISALDREDELYLVARVSCFRDQTLANAGIGGPLMTRGGNVWYDPQGLRWVSPVSQQVRDYLTRLCTELAEMGFDEILLECPGFPDQGETYVLATSEYHPVDLTGPAGQFLEEVTAALEETEAKVSLMVSADAVLGTNTLSGLTASSLAQYAHRIWVALPAQGEQPLVSALEQAGMEHASDRLVSLGGARTGGSWTTLSAPDTAG